MLGVINLFVMIVFICSIDVGVVFGTTGVIGAGCLFVVMLNGGNCSGGSDLGGIKLFFVCFVR